MKRSIFFNKIYEAVLQFFVFVVECNFFLVHRIFLFEFEVQLPLT